MNERERADAILKQMCAAEISSKEETDLQQELGFDSLRMVEVIVRMEELFDCELSESDLDPDQLKTVGDLYRILRI